ncbi:MAG: NAD(P)/FAD-dependent oxidoreductase [Deltaproteobacteria bacterium]|nr:NAD(P)/FAD-dependent oxidoreductase [Deltaproteobacteria bacterium]
MTIVEYEGKVMPEFDVVIVGSGTAGQTAAYDLKAAGLRVAVIESSDRPGGTCALAGCQPKKWFYEAAETVSKSSHLKGRGIMDAATGSWPQVLKEKNKFTSGVSRRTVDGFHEAGIEYIEGSARFVTPDTLAVGSLQIRSHFIVLATGARPMSLEMPGKEHLVLSDAFMELESLPERILFVGGGFIAFEFAHFAARLGPVNSHLVILEAGDRPLGPFDLEMVDLLVQASREVNIDIITGVQVVAIEKKAEGFSVKTRSGLSHETDLVVHGAGRTPNIEALNLNAGGVVFNKRGIVVNEYMMTATPSVYAVGDCADSVQLARVADFEGHTAAANVLANFGMAEPATISYEAVPAVLFTYPQYAMVGKTEAALQKEGIAYRKSFGKNLRWPTYQRIGLTHAAYKILVSADGRFLGAHFLSDNASGLVNTLRLAMINGITVEQLYRQSIMSPYPTRESDLIYMLKPLLAL